MVRKLAAYLICFFQLALLLLALPPIASAQADLCPIFIITDTSDPDPTKHKNYDVRAAPAVLPPTVKNIVIFAGGNLNPKEKYQLFIDDQSSLYGQPHYESRIETQPDDLYYPFSIGFSIDPRGIITDKKGQQTRSPGFAAMAFTPGKHSISIRQSTDIFSGYVPKQVCRVNIAYNLEAVPVSADCKIAAKPLNNINFLPGEPIIIEGTLPPDYDKDTVAVDIVNPSGKIMTTNCAIVNKDVSIGPLNFFQTKANGEAGESGFWQAHVFRGAFKVVPACQKDLNLLTCPPIPFQVTGLTPIPTIPPGSTVGVIGKRDLCQTPGGTINAKCEQCLGGIDNVATGKRKLEDEKAWTALGCLDITPVGFTMEILRILIGLSGGIGLLLIIYAGFKIMTSAGNAEAIQAAREMLTSTIVGLLFMIFSVFILQFLAVQILALPGFR